MVDQFYEKINSFSNFNDAFDIKNYHSVPKDWFVVITDIKNSTVASESGKYKDVNLIGTSCIGAVLKFGDFPYAFGGDGASFLIPPEQIKFVKRELLKIKNSAKRRFDLDLRVGVVPVKVISEKFDIKVARFDLAKGRSIAKFSGGGLSYADVLVKECPEYLICNESVEEETSFDRISCRWNPVRSQYGKILTLMIKADSLPTYQKIQDELDNILGLDEVKLNPIKPDIMSYRKLLDIYQDEKKFEDRLLSLTSLKRKMEIVTAFILFSTFRSSQPKFLRKYTESMRNYSDYRKFDDVLRMVIDCSVDQINKIFLALDNFPGITYGYSCSDHALMTCLVYGLNEGEHIHFVDGADGGYNSASKMIKNIESSTAIEIKNTD